ncbi:MAG: hypothetical protein QME52_07900 [Bacteroidota bacterium]|nr:hypothetical protein [Bacteroidota bacterium]
MVELFRGLISVLIISVIGAGIWYGGFLLFHNTVQDLKNTHCDVSLSDFPWNRAYTPTERVNLLKTFTYVHTPYCLDSLVEDARKLDFYEGRKSEEILLNLYDFLILSRDSNSVDSLKKSSQFFLTQLRRNVPKYTKISDKEVLSQFKKCLSDAVYIRRAELDCILKEKWIEKHQGQIGLVSNILNLTYGLAFSLTLLIYIRKLLTKRKTQQ